MAMSSMPLADVNSTTPKTNNFELTSNGLQKRLDVLREVILCETIKVQRLIEEVLLLWLVVQYFLLR